MERIETAAKSILVMYEVVMYTYAMIFDVWADYYFVIQIILFFALTTVLYIGIKYLIIPLFLFIYANAIFRGWNFLVTESIYEALYLLFMSDPKKTPPTFFVTRYKNYERTVKQNRAYIDKEILTNETYIDQTYRKIINTRLSKKLLKIVKILIILWIFFFFIFLIFHF